MHDLQRAAAATPLRLSVEAAHNANDPPAERAQPERDIRPVTDGLEG